MITDDNIFLKNEEKIYFRCDHPLSPALFLYLYIYLALLYERLLLRTNVYKLFSGNYLDAVLVVMKEVSVTPKKLSVLT